MSLTQKQQLDFIEKYKRLDKLKQKNIKADAARRAGLSAEVDGPDGSSSTSLPTALLSNTDETDDTQKDISEFQDFLFQIFNNVQIGELLTKNLEPGFIRAFVGSPELQQKFTDFIKTRKNVSSRIVTAFFTDMQDKYQTERFVSKSSGLNQSQISNQLAAEHPEVEEYSNMIRQYANHEALNLFVAFFKKTAKITNRSLSKDPTSWIQEAETRFKNSDFEYFEKVKKLATYSRWLEKFDRAAILNLFQGFLAKVYRNDFELENYEDSLQRAINKTYSDIVRMSYEEQQLIRKAIAASSTVETVAGIDISNLVVREIENVLNTFDKDALKQFSEYYVPELKLPKISAYRGQGDIISKADELPNYFIFLLILNFLSQDMKEYKPYFSVTEDGLLPNVPLRNRPSTGKKRPTGPTGSTGSTGSASSTATAPPATPTKGPTKADDDEEEDLKVYSKFKESPTKMSEEKFKVVLSGVNKSSTILDVVKELIKTNVTDVDSMMNAINDLKFMNKIKSDARWSPSIGNESDAATRTRISDYLRKKGIKPSGGSIVQSGARIESPYYIDDRRLGMGLLQVRYRTNQHLLPHFQPVIISKPAAELVKTVGQGLKIDKGKFDRLEKHEQHIVKRAAGLFGVSNPEIESDDMDERWEVLKGEILSGNTSELIKREARQMIRLAVQLGKITHKDASFIIHDLGL